MNLPSPTSLAPGGPAAFSLLLVEDNPGDARLVRELLREAHTSDAGLVHAVRLSEALERLAEPGIEVVLLDLSLPDAHGLDTVKRVRAAAPLVPIVVMSGQGDEATAVSALGEGAQDYLVKGQVDGATLVRALRYAVERGKAAAALAEQNRLLEARNAEQETFVYTVSHDLRAPLVSIRGMAELLGEALARSDREEATYLLTRISKNAEKMSALLNDLLALSRVGRVEEEPESLDLGELAASVVAELEPRIRERGVLVELAGGWPCVLYPRMGAYQLLANLVGNATKFAGRPGERPRVSLAWELDPSSPGLVTVRVSDNGAGVAPQYRDQVFGLFKKLDAKAEGTGVGLAIVKRIAERHGGQAWVEDSLSPPVGLGGATFAVTMPTANAG